MSNISGMDYNNTPFSIPTQMVGGKDEPSIMTPSYISANRRNVEHVIRHINNNAKNVQKSILELTEEINIFKEIWEMSDDTETITISVDRLQKILALAENLNLSFNNLLRSTE